MRTFKLDIEDDRVVIRGQITMPDLNLVIKNYCKTHWVIDSDEAEKLGVNFVIREPDHAVNQ